MKEFSLPPRLEAIATHVIPGHSMADIGTDHALLPCALVGRKIVPNALACERHRSPLRAASRTIHQAGLQELIALRLGDGLTNLGRSEVATIVIAGMGGRLIARIIESIHKVGPVRVIMQAQSDLEFLRRVVIRLGMQLIDECLVVDKNRYYPIMIANSPCLDGHRGKSDNIRSPEQWSHLDWQWGPFLRRSSHPLYKDWLIRCRGIIDRRRQDKRLQSRVSEYVRQRWDQQYAEFSAEIGRITPV